MLSPFPSMKSIVSIRRYAESPFVEPPRSSYPVNCFSFADVTLDAIAFSSQLPSSHTRNVATSRERTRAAQRYQQQQSSGNSSNSSNSSRGNNDANCCNDVQGKKGRPGTRRSEDSMLGSSRWATIHKPITRLAVCRDGQG